MEATQPQLANSKNNTLIPMVKEALADAPIFIAHICKTLSTCHQKFRLGDDQAGMTAFARSASDLGNFVQLFDQMATLSCPMRSVATNAFRRDLCDSLRSIEVAMNNQDLVTVSDQIEVALIPLLQRWSLVAQELQTGLDGQR